MVRTEVLRTAMLVSVFALLALSCKASREEPYQFDGARAYRYLEQQVAYGPRIPGTAGHANTRDWIVALLKQHTAHVSIQPFRGISAGTEVGMENILASFYPEKKDRVLLCAHWDTRPHADRDPDSTRWNEPVPGANDGASGVAVLLEIAVVIGKHEPPVGIDMAFFDGEDGGEYGRDETWLLGSRYFARVMTPSYRPRYAILLDMIGDRNLELTADYHSITAAPALWGRVVRFCRRAGIAVSSNQIGILDDHIPLIARGIPAVDLIDFEYPYWHTVDDTPDKCSPESLRKIGGLVLTLIFE